MQKTKIIKFNTTIHQTVSFKRKKNTIIFVLQFAKVSKN